MDTQTDLPRIVVVKVGSSTLTTDQGRLNHAYLDALAMQLASLCAAGVKPVVVSSAAIACGVERLGLSTRPTDMPGLQAAASVGQEALIRAWDEALSAHGIISSLVLLTRRDTADRTAYLHARDTLLKLLDFNVVPIVNENDTVSVDQIKFGDNDTLSALVACLISADMTVILSDVAGLYTANPALDPDARLIERVEAIDETVVRAATGPVTTVGSGGMVTKISAARILQAAGIPLVICDGMRDNAVVDAVNGKSVGTLFSAAHQAHEITPRKLWIALGDAVSGALVVDDGARRALERQGSSLLAVGVVEAQGSFEAGDIVDVKARDGYVFARGKIGAGKDFVDLACGKTQAELAANSLLADLGAHALIHRDDLIVFG